MTDAENPVQPEFDLGPAEIKEDPMTHTVKKLYFHRPSPVVVTDAKKGKSWSPLPVIRGEAPSPLCVPARAR